MKKYFITIISMMLFSSFAVAGNINESEKRFMKLDEDKNGGLSITEARQGNHRVVYFHDAADTNNDGHVDKAEFSAFELKDAPE